MAIDLGTQKQLFLDRRWFASENGMSLTVNPPIKQERGILPETPWENMRLNAGSTIIEDGGRYRLWYGASAPVVKAEDCAHRRGLCYAESNDGITWHRKNVNLFEWEGIAENNIVMPGAHGGIMIDPHNSAEHRYKALCKVHENKVWPESKGALTGYWEGKRFVARMELYLCTSPDGIHWTRQKTPASNHFHDTHNHLIYDDRIGKYAAYLRTHKRRRTVGRLELEDPMELPWIPLEEGHPANGKYIPTVLEMDETDPPDCDLYTPAVHKYPWAQDAYFSFTTPYRHYPVADTTDTTLQGNDERGSYRNDGPVEIQIAVSRDGINFTRPDRRPYVRPGIVGAWDGGQIYMSLGMIRKGDEIYQYYGGTSHTHGAYQPGDARREGGLGRLVQRLDGFISADADYRGADFTTPLLTFDGPNLTLNVDCAAMGQVWTELRDENNHPIPGYTLAESIDVDRNHTAAPVRWRERDNVGELMGRPLYVHFKLRACKLYAFKFCTE